MAVTSLWLQRTGRHLRVADACIGCPCPYVGRQLPLDADGIVVPLVVAQYEVQTLTPYCCRHYVNKTMHPDFDPYKRTKNMISAAFYDQMVVLVSCCSSSLSLAGDPLLL